jgi:hypothetical protein
VHFSTHVKRYLTEYRGNVEDLFAGHEMEALGSPAQERCNLELLRLKEHPVITFSQADAGLMLQYGQGCWSRASARKCSVVFTMPAEIDGAFARRISGTLLLDELGALRGPVIAEGVDASGRVVDSIPGVAKAKRIDVPHREESFRNESIRGMPQFGSSQCS